MESVVQIVGPTDNWILNRMCKQLASKLPYAEFAADRPKLNCRPGLVYYVNYALFRRKTHHIDVGFFTHIENAELFLDTALRLDHSICMSRIYSNWLAERGVKEVTHIPTGYDRYRFRPKLVLGVAGLLDHPRKGRHIVESLRQLDFVEIRVTGGKMSDRDVREFYQSLDFVFIPAIVEGGPMSLLEGLGAGKPVIAPDSVGMVPEFSGSNFIKTYPTGDVVALTELLNICYREKCSISATVENRTLDNWAATHHQLFERLFALHGISFPQPGPSFRFGIMSELKIPANMETSALEAAIDRLAADLYFDKRTTAIERLRPLLSPFPFTQPLLEELSSSNTDRPLQ